MKNNIECMIHSSYFILLLSIPAAISKPMAAKTVNPEVDFPVPPSFCPDCVGMGSALIKNSLEPG